MAPPLAHAGTKRKQHPPSSNSSQHASQSRRTQDHAHKKRRPNVQDARRIAAQTTTQAYGAAATGSESGHLNVDKFVRAREFEIKALEQGMRNARGALNQRAFQGVPKDLRRRTASHDVKRVPKRLRARAKKEMKDDNTPGTAERRKKKRRERGSKGWLRASGRATKARTRRLSGMNAGSKAGEAGASKGLLKAMASSEELAKDADVEMTDQDQPQPQPQPQGDEEAPEAQESRRRKRRLADGVLQKAPLMQPKFRKRQIHKAWLPTHIYHAKRAHMPPPKEPLWRMAIPLSPTAKCYRPTHRASRTRGAVAWDMSYMSTIGLSGSEDATLDVLDSLGVDWAQAPARKSIKSARWQSGTRFWYGWLLDNEETSRSAIAPATIIWDVAIPAVSVKAQQAGDQLTEGTNQPQPRTRNLLIRLHPSAFLQVWERLLPLCKKAVPGVGIQDLRYEIGSIDVTGPAAAEALVGTLWPSRVEQVTRSDSPENVWTRLRRVTDAASMPMNAMLGFDACDPRLHHPPKKLKSAGDLQQAYKELMQLLTAWPLDGTQTASRLFDGKSRWRAGRSLPSQKAINRRKSLAGPGEYAKAVEGDPQIPVVVLASRERRGGMGTWTVLLPWKCVLPVWYCLMHYPLLSGGSPRFGGLDEKRQIAFEIGQGWFPGDYAGTAAGAAWEMSERSKRHRAWERRPKGKRVEYDSVDLGLGTRGECGLGWACDWQYLFSGSSSEVAEKRCSPMRHVSLGAASGLLAGSGAEAEGILATVHIALVTRGVPTTCARIYRLPSQDVALRERWLQLLTTARETGDSARPVTVPEHLQAHEKRRILAASLLEPPLPRTGEADYPAVPGAEDLIGFVTSGNFNLGEGRGTAMGCIALQKVLEHRQGSSAEASQQERVCIVRNAGQSVGRVARWELR